MAGVDPGPLTLRGLVWMAQARRAEAWKHTSSLMALIANVLRSSPRNERAYEPSDFDPTLKWDSLGSEGGSGSGSGGKSGGGGYLTVSAAEFGRILFGNHTHG